MLVAAHVDEVGAKYSVSLADERVGTVPFVYVEVFVEVVGDRVPGDVLPTVTLLQTLDVALRRA
jgi:hypothetical protein